MFLEHSPAGVVKSGSLQGAVIIIPAIGRRQIATSAAHVQPRYGDGLQRRQWHLFAHLAVEGRGKAKAGLIPNGVFYQLQVA